MFRSTLLAATAAIALSSPAFAQQEGLVNVDVSGNTIQVPVSAAAQVCGIDADVLTANFVDTDEVACRIDQETAARHNIGGNQGGAQGAAQGQGGGGGQGGTQGQGGQGGGGQGGGG